MVCVRTRGPPLFMSFATTVSSKGRRDVLGSRLIPLIKNRTNSLLPMKESNRSSPSLSGWSLYNLDTRPNSATSDDPKGRGGGPKELDAHQNNIVGNSCPPSPHLSRGRFGIILSIPSIPECCCPNIFDFLVPTHSQNLDRQVNMTRVEAFS